MAAVSPDFSLVIPVYNERENIEELLSAVGRALGGPPSPFPLPPKGGEDKGEGGTRAHSYEIIVVDDASPDGAGALVEKFGAEHPEVRLLRRAGKMGLGSAVVEGFKASRGRILGVMDADFSHDPALLPRLVKAVEEGSPVAVGSRYMPGGGVEGWPFRRVIASRAASIWARARLGVELSDPMSGYFALRRDVFESVAAELDPKGFKIFLEIMVRAGLNSAAEIPYVFRNRTRGKSKMGPGEMLRYLALVRELEKARAPLSGGSARLIKR